MKFRRGFFVVIPMLFLMSTVSIAYGDTALHGFCWGTTPACVDNGTNTPTSTPQPDFGFWIGGGPTSGDYVIDVLVPNNEDPTPSLLSFAIGGTESGTASLFNAAAWTSGQLGAYLGNNGSPANPIGAYLPATQGLDKGATGFFVYQADLGHSTLGGSAGTGPLETISGPLPVGSYLVGFLNEGATRPDWHATANSGAIFETPEPSSYALLLGAGLVLVGFARKTLQRS